MLIKLNQLSNFDITIAQKKHRELNSKENWVKSFASIPKGFNKDMYMKFFLEKKFQFKYYTLWFNLLFSLLMG